MEKVTVSKSNSKLGKSIYNAYFGQNYLLCMSVFLTHYWENFHSLVRKWPTQFLQNPCFLIKHEKKCHTHDDEGSLKLYQGIVTFRFSDILKFDTSRVSKESGTLVCLALPGKTWPPKGSCLSVQFSSSVVSDSLRLHELQHARPPCPSPAPGVHSDSRPLSWWCHPAISSSVIPFSSCPQFLPASGFFPVSQLFAWGGQSTEVSAVKRSEKQRRKGKI